MFYFFSWENVALKLESYVYLPYFIILIIFNHNDFYTDRNYVLEPRPIFNAPRIKCRIAISTKIRSSLSDFSQILEKFSSIFFY